MIETSAGLHRSSEPSAASDGGKHRSDHSGRSWRFALLWTGLLVSAFVALTGPGRIDVIDGEARYEVSRSLVDRGRLSVEQPTTSWSMARGREGRIYSVYRIPQSLLAVPALLFADALGGQSEPRRHFFFTLTGAWVAGLLSIAFAIWFRSRGLRPGPAIRWGLAGVVLTPAWFYATSTFDDLLAATAGVSALVLATRFRTTAHPVSLGAAAIALGAAFAVKPTMGVFMLPTLAAALAPNATRRDAARIFAWLAAGLALAALLTAAALHLRFSGGRPLPLEQGGFDYLAAFPGTPAAGLVSILVSPGKGLPWYFPALPLCLVGLVLARSTERWLFWAAVAAGSILTAFVGSLSFFGGDPAWGPRYLLPLVVLYWLFSPWGAGRLGRTTSRVLLALSLLVQLASVAVDPHRLYIERGFASAFYVADPWVFFDLRASHLVQRPREIVECLRSKGNPAKFAPRSLATLPPPPIDFTPRGPEAVRKFQIYRALRPWWIAWGSWPGLPPVPLANTLVTLLLLIAIAGTGLWRCLVRLESALGSSYSADP